MAVDRFLIEGKREAPVEFRAWIQAKDEQIALHSRAARAMEQHGKTSSEYLAIDAEGVALVARIIELETTARAAWLWGSKK